MRSNKIDIIGKIFSCKKGGDYVVEEELYHKDTEYYYRIRFLETGATRIVEKRNLRSGNVRDYYSKTIYGVACKGMASSTHPELNKVAFKRWEAMISRCYNENNINYKSYGGSGVHVSDDWLCFENYINDIVSLPGYDEQEYLNGEIQLDKDTKCKGNKLYSKDNCVFLPRIENIRYQATKLKPFEAISPDGEKFVFENQVKCAEAFNLHPRTIGKVLNGQLKTHHGWRFKYIV